jgi:hypothetical protein
MGYGRLRGIIGRVRGRGGILGEACCPLALAGSAGRRSRPQQQVDPIGTGDGGRVRHPLPQPQRAAQMTQRLDRGQDRLSLLRCPDRGTQGTDEVVAGQAMVGELGRDALGLGGEQAGIGGV